MSVLLSRAKHYGTLVALALAVTALHAVGVLEFAERPLQNLRFRVLQRQARGDVVLVAIDSKSLRALNHWPLSDKRYAEAVDSLTKAGAKRIALAVDLADRSSPGEERVLEDALLKAGGSIVLPAVHADGERAGESELERLPPQSLRARSTMASFDLIRDGDGLVRRYRLRDTFEGKPVPTLAASMSDGLPLLGETFSIDLGIKPDSIPRISFADVTSGRYDPASVAGKLVVIGVTAPEIAGAVALPTNRSAPVIVHALALESLSRERAIYRGGSVMAFVFALSLLLWLDRKRAWLLSRGKLVPIVACIAACVAVSAVVQLAIPIMLDVSPWILAVVGLVGLADVPARSEAARPERTRSQRFEQMMRQVVDNSFDAIIQVDGGGVIEVFNEAAQRMFGYPSTEAVGRFIGDLVLPLESSLVTKVSADAFHFGPTTREAIGLRKDRSKFPVELRIAEIDDGGSRRRVGTLRDITERKAHERALEHQARHDPLTGLPNRVLLREQVVSALKIADRDNSEVGFLNLDLDRFKDVNDTLGHHVGDMLLQQIGERLKGALRQSDTIARMGGDEFAVLLPGTDGATARDVARRLVESLALPFDMQGLSLQIEASIGIAMFPQDGKVATDVIQRADVAMYVAKRERTGFAVYEPERDFNSVRHLTLNGELRKAIDENHLVLYYQPKISAKDGKIVGAEALVRWNHPLFGIISPDDFIALAEHSGLIKPLTRWVLNEAMRQSAEWCRKGFPITMAVNVSARNLLEKEMPEETMQLLESHALPPELLVCEITESVIMEDRRRSLGAIMELVDLGITIAIDDFGTGYSSLAYLRQLPAAEIKIDKSFVMKMDREQDDAVIVAATIQMARSLGMRIVAEGVENERIWSDLIRMGCDYGQGYFFSRPIEAEAFFALLQSTAEISPFLPLLPPKFEPEFGSVDYDVSEERSKPAEV